MVSIQSGALLQKKRVLRAGHVSVLGNATKLETLLRPHFWVTLRCTHTKTFAHQMQILVGLYIVGTTYMRNKLICCVLLACSLRGKSNLMDGSCVVRVLF